MARQRTARPSQVEIYADTSYDNVPVVIGRQGYSTDSSNQNVIRLGLITNPVDVKNARWNKTRSSSSNWLTTYEATNDMILSPGGVAIYHSIPPEYQEENDNGTTRFFAKSHVFGSHPFRKLKINFGSTIEVHTINKDVSIPVGTSVEISGTPGQIHTTPVNDDLDLVWCGGTGYAITGKRLIQANDGSTVSSDFATNNTVWTGFNEWYPFLSAKHNNLVAFNTSFKEGHQGLVPLNFDMGNLPGGVSNYIAQVSQNDGQYEYYSRYIYPGGVLGIMMTAYLMVFNTTTGNWEQYTTETGAIGTAFFSPFRYGNKSIDYIPSGATTNFTDNTKDHSNIYWGKFVNSSITSGLGPTGLYGASGYAIFPQSGTYGIQSEQSNTALLSIDNPNAGIHVAEYTNPTYGVNRKWWGSTGALVGRFGLGFDTGVFPGYTYPYTGGYTTKDAVMPLWNCIWTMKFSDDGTGTYSIPANRWISGGTVTVTDRAIPDTERLRYVSNVATNNSLGSLLINNYAMDASTSFEWSLEGSLVKTIIKWPYITWQPYGNRLAFGNGVFVLAGHSVAWGTGGGTFGNYNYYAWVYTTSDGVNWSRYLLHTRDQSTPYSWLPTVLLGFDETAGEFVARVTATGVDVTLRSTDGANWVSQIGNESPLGQPLPVFGNGIYMDIPGNYPRISNDNVNWRIAQNKPFTDVNWPSVAFGNGVFVAVSNHNATVYSNVRSMTSINGTDWNIHILSTNIGQRSIVVFNKGMFIAMGAAAGVAVSPDGVNWTVHPTPVTATWTSLREYNGILIAKTSTNVTMTSPDGINWTLLGTSTNQWPGITYGNGTFVAVSSNAVGSRILTSTDGWNWTFQITPQNNAWQSVAYGQGQFVAVSNTGTNRVMTSPDGVTWTLRTISTSYAWNHIAFGNNRFVAIASTNDRAISSKNGVTWANDVSIPSGVTSLTFDKSIKRFVITTANYRYISKDGVTWTLVSSTINAWADNSVAGNGIYVTINDGDLWTSTDNEFFHRVVKNNGRVLAPTNYEYTVYTDINETEWLPVAQKNMGTIRTQVSSLQKYKDIKWNDEITSVLSGANNPFLLQKPEAENGEMRQVKGVTASLTATGVIPDTNYTLSPYFTNATAMSNQGDRVSIDHWTMLWDTGLLAQTVTKNRIQMHIPTVIRYTATGKVTPVYTE